MFFLSDAAMATSPNSGPGLLLPTVPGRIEEKTGGQSEKRMSSDENDADEEGILQGMIR